ncbi:Crp/Fnr family transcriptional regulator [Flavobacterium filum]|uniref:Crp/Fnr family transcriptional regulator n=1 Tax=Flavobacterium filum TaxID=370974 RepID=UPI0023F56473|nr:Crp/Fnr family transcriptional regulator [Flavobacterium filum]
MNSDLKYWYLQNHQLFRNLSYAEINMLCILKKFKRSKKNELIDLSNSDKDRLYFLKHGTIKLIRITPDGDELVVDILQKGDLFGDLNLEHPEDNQEFFKVVSDEAIICTFYREKLEEVMYKKPDFALNYIKFIGFNFKKIQNSYKNILFRDAKTRLLLLLHTIIEKENVVSPSYVLPNYLTQKDIAQLICTTRQTIVSLFKELEKQGVLNYTQKEISIPDVALLKNLVQNVK